MKYLVAVILLFFSISGYSQYQGEPSVGSRIKPNQIRSTTHPTANHIYVITSDSATGLPYWGLINKNGGGGGGQSLSNTSTGTTHTVTLSSSGGSFQLAEGSNISLTTTGTTNDGIVTIGASFSGLVPDTRMITTTAPLIGGNDLSGDITLSTSLASGKLAGRASSGTGVIEAISLGTGLSFSGTTLNISDNSDTNEGLLSVGAGSSVNSLIISNTTGSPDITIEGAGNNAVTEVGNKIIITGTEVDGSTTNEIQTLSIFAGKGTIKLTNGSSASTFIQLADSSKTNEIQTLSLLAGGGTLKLTNGAGAASTFVQLKDSSITNEIQTLSLNTVGTIKLTNGLSASTFLNLPDSSSSNEIQTLSIFAGKGTLKLTNGASASTFIQLADSSATNEIQTISRYLLGLKLTNGTSASTFISLPDSSSANEGILTASLSSTNNSQILSNTTGATAVHIIAAGTNTLGVSGQNITITGADAFVGTVTSVSGTTDRITVATGTTTPVIDIASTYVGQTSITTLGTITTGTWTGTDIALSRITQVGANTILANPTTGTADISTISLSASNLAGRGSTGNVAAITVGGILSFSGTVLSATEVDGSISNEGSLTVLAGVSTNSILHSNTSTSADVTISVTGNIEIDESGNLITLSSTDPDESKTNEGALTVNAGTSTTSIISSNTFTSTDVTISVGGINTISESGNLITITGTEVDGSTTNEIQTLSKNSTGTLKLTNGAAASTFINLPDSSSTNELQTLSVASGVTTLSQSGGSMTIAGGGINTIGTAGSTITITGTEVDGSISNEGSLTVAAGTSSSSIFHSNTSTSADITVSVAGGMSISESGNAITLTGGQGTIKWIKAGTAVYEKGIDVAFNANKDTSTISLNYPTMVTIDSFLSNKSDWVAVSPVVADVTNNSKISAFNFKKERTRTITTSKPFDADDSQGIVILNGASITYTLESSPTDGEEVSFVNLQTSSFPTISGNSKNINGSSTYVFSSQYEKIKIRYFASLTKWLIIP